MQRSAVLTVAVLAALATGGALAVSGGAQESGGRTIEFVTRDGEFKFIDVAPRARSEEDARAGDGFALSSRLFTKAGKRAGSLDATCSFTKGGKDMRGHCEGVYALADGDIYVAARVSSSSDVAGAVVGGTRAYAGARGTFVSKDPPGTKDGDPNFDTVTLLP